MYTQFTCFYWYKRANADAAGGAGDGGAAEEAGAGASSSAADLNCRCQGQGNHSHTLNSLTRIPELKGAVDLTKALLTAQLDVRLLSYLN